MAPVPSTETLRPLRLLARDPEPVPTAAPDGTWWGCYSGALTRLSPASAAVVEMDARYIVERADPIPLPGHERVSVYPPERVRTGIVVGSVQSGKTASMLGLAALLLDRGVDVLVVLSGTRVALWLQTYARLLAQLDGSNRENAWKRDSVRALVPNPFDVLGNELRADPRRYLRGQRRRVERAFAAGRPVLFVTPKEDDHLLELARFLAKVVPDSALEQRAEPIRMVVLDDEADLHRDAAGQLPSSVPQSAQSTPLPCESPNAVRFGVSQGEVTHIHRAKRDPQLLLRRRDVLRAASWQRR